MKSRNRHRGQWQCYNGYILLSHNSVGVLKGEWMLFKHCLNGDGWKTICLSLTLERGKKWHASLNVMYPSLLISVGANKNLWRLQSFDEEETKHEVHAGCAGILWFSSALYWTAVVDMILGLELMSVILYYTYYSNTICHILQSLIFLN